MSSRRKRFSDQIRGAINSSGQTRYAIWKATGIEQGTLSRFMDGTGNLKIAQLDLVAELFNLRVATDRSKKGR